MQIVTKEKHFLKKHVNLFVKQHYCVLLLLLCTATATVYCVLLLRTAYCVLQEPMSIESRKKWITNMRPVTITNLDGSNPIYFVSSKEASIVISCKTIRRAVNVDGGKKMDC